MAGVPEKIGNIDKNVVEAAVRLKEATGARSAGAMLWPSSRPRIVSKMCWRWGWMKSFWSRIHCNGAAKLGWRSHPGSCHSQVGTIRPDPVRFCQRRRLYLPGGAAPGRTSGSAPGFLCPPDQREAMDNYRPIATWKIACRPWQCRCRPWSALPKKLSRPAAPP